MEAMQVVKLVRAGRRPVRIGWFLLAGVVACAVAACGSDGATSSADAANPTAAIVTTPTPSKLRSGAGADPTAAPEAGRADTSTTESAGEGDADAASTDSDESVPPVPTAAPVAVPTPTPVVVYVSPDDDFRKLVNDYDEGTTFYIRAGVHLGDRAFPKAGQVFIGEPGAIFDGDGIGAPAFSATRKEGSDGVVIRDLEIRNYQPGRNNGAISARPLDEDDLEGKNWTISGNVIHGNGGAGINVASGMVIEDNYIYDNRQIGISGLGSGERPLVDMVITNNTIEANNAAPYDEFEYHEGGIKLNGAASTEITKNWIAGNWGFGLHCDRQCDDVLIEGNIVRDAKAHVGRDGDRAFAAEVYVELSTNVTIRANEVVVDESIPSGQRDKAIRVNESQNIVVEGNTLVLGDADADHIMSLGFNSCCDRPPTSDTTFRNNTVEAVAGTILVGSRDIDPDGGNIVFEDNTYIERGGTFEFRHRAAPQTWTEWQDLGYDTAGTLR